MKKFKKRIQFEKELRKSFTYETPKDTKRHALWLRRGPMHRRRWCRGASFPRTWSVCSQNPNCHLTDRSRSADRPFYLAAPLPLWRRKRDFGKWSKIIGRLSTVVVDGVGRWWPIVVGKGFNLAVDSGRWVGEKFEGKINGINEYTKSRLSSSLSLKFSSWNSTCRPLARLVDTSHFEEPLL